MFRALVLPGHEAGGVPESLDSVGSHKKRPGENEDK